MPIATTSNGILKQSVGGLLFSVVVCLVFVY